MTTSQVVTRRRRMMEIAASNNRMNLKFIDIAQNPLADTPDLKTR